jgi:hypothetical protein
MEKGIWFNRKGEELKIKDMETAHVINCMCMLIGKVYLMGTGVIKKRCTREMIMRLDKYNEFLKEYKRRDK